MEYHIFIPMQNLAFGTPNIAFPTPKHNVPNFHVWPRPSTQFQGCQIMTFLTLKWCYLNKSWHKSTFRAMACLILSKPVK